MNIRLSSTPTHLSCIATSESAILCCHRVGVATHSRQSCRFYHIRPQPSHLPPHHSVILPRPCHVNHFAPYQIEPSRPMTLMGRRLLVVSRLFRSYFLRIHIFMTWGLFTISPCLRPSSVLFAILGSWPRLSLVPPIFPAPGWPFIQEFSLSRTKISCRRLLYVRMVNVIF